MLNNVMKKTLLAALCAAVVFAGVSCGKKPLLPKEAAEIFETASSGAGKVIDTTKGALETVGEKIDSSGVKEAAQQAVKTSLAQAQDAFSTMNADEMLAALRKMLPEDVKFIPCAKLQDAKKELKKLHSKTDITKLKFLNLSDGLQVLDAIGFVLDVSKALNPTSIALGVAIDLAPEVLTKMGFGYGIFSIQNHIVIVRMEKGDWEFAATA